ncbi:transcription repressor OFP17 [Cinnamomum micranthum f. kanehirae]|uniref:Transcription repressor OFP17 n=1 Tax=Cinnamomum micranthum f. kanehirae TaxID=337451 RepID=A0A443NRT9_9MAGN|nr:transcription repressor OFP17 [Cinnamomum micranthum f. kanehirae]
MMPTSSSVTLKAKLLKPFKKLLHVFKFKLKRPIFRSFSRFRKLRGTASQKTHPKKRIHRLLPFFRSSMKSEESDVVGELRSVPEAAQERALFPSPITPAYVRAGEGVGRREVASRKDVIEDSCRSFENYLVEMIVEEGKMKDLTDVEELLCCWKNLKCPVFHDLNHGWACSIATVPSSSRKTGATASLTVSLRHHYRLASPAARPSSLRKRTAERGHRLLQALGGRRRKPSWVCSRTQVSGRFRSGST